MTQIDIYYAYLQLNIQKKYNYRNNRKHPFIHPYHLVNEILYLKLTFCKL
jgi:hypothetical protein